MFATTTEKKNFIVDRSALIFRKEIWNKPDGKSIALSSLDRNTLIDSHLRLTFWLAANICPPNSLLSEFIGEACLGLVEEADKAISIERKNGFSKLLTRNVINKLVGLKRFVKTPVKVSKNYYTFYNQVNKTIERLKKEFETENICSLDVYGLLDKTRIPEFMGIVNPFSCQSFDAPINEESSFYDVTPIDDFAPDELVEKYRETKDKLLVIFKKILSDMEFVVITEMFGLLREEPKTTAQICGMLGMGAGKVYQCYQSAISKLKNNEILEMLMAFQDMDVSRYYKFEDINREFEKQYLKVLSKNYTSKNLSTNNFTEEEISWLTENYKKLTPAEALIYINEGREVKYQFKPSQFRTRVAALGLVNSIVYTPEDDDLIRRYYGRIPDQELADLLTRQSKINKTFSVTMVKRRCTKLKIKKKDICAFSK